ncbi:MULTISPECIES: hypothetical protein [unclassified Pseudophaeobacter]|uniref:hypothetical protein n=1 Tax=unclassified Pseudophaeobacter TaxID=2637024 RepID=UPI000EFB0429|nr:hypothetical protein [Pseudophaeobacter sp. EL27]
MFRKISLFCLALFAALPAAAQSISNHFEKHSDSCYQRFYSASHLASHPVQKVEAIQLSHFNHESRAMPGGEMNLRIAVRLRGRSTWQTPVICRSQGNRLSCGVECDGGRFDVVVKNGSSILITGGTDIYFSDCNAKPRILERAPDDKVFMLHRQPLSNCRP